MARYTHPPPLPIATTRSTAHSLTGAHHHSTTLTYDTVVHAPRHALMHTTPLTLRTPRWYVVLGPVHAVPLTYAACCMRSTGRGVVPCATMNECKCEWAERPLGRLHGIDMGQGMVRITTHPRCPVHSLCRHYTAQVRAGRSNGRWLWCPVHERKPCPV